jgi:DNA modification methylase
MKITREWEMPNSNTFDIKAIRNFIGRHLSTNDYSIDPFANKNRMAKVTNDIDPVYKCDFSLDALEFLKTVKSNSVDVVLFDPPYSPRQIKECYTKLGLTVWL